MNVRTHTHTQEMPKQGRQGDTKRKKIEEAKQKNEARSEEEESHFFLRVVGLQVRKWYKNNREMETAEGPDQQTHTRQTAE